MKKRGLYYGGVLALTLTLGLFMAGCGGSNAKDLAKQSYELTKQAMEAASEAASDPAKALEITRKLADIEQKVKKLSESEKAVFAKEFARLSGKDAADILENIDL
ncbi:MAG: hypothetical protein Pg6A_17010 [Termitinemataceae bacterium]|jgi:hypothetical protein|nr:MAG: hypothetical protein Pg6A_17010 [Termitinemataceae bacterium]